MPHIVADIWHQVQHSLLPHLEVAFQEPLSEAHRKVVGTLEVVRVEEYVKPASWQMRGRPLCHRGSIARAFVAKAVLDIPTTKRLREMLLADRVLRGICGLERQRDVPSEPTLSRAFAEFSRCDLAVRVHAALVEQHVGDLPVIDVLRDSTEIEVREKALKKPPKEPKPRQKCGRKAKDDPPRELTRLERQRQQTPEEALAELPRACDVGAKRDANGFMHHWKGLKGHIDWADNGMPLAVQITSASVHDSQVAIPMSKELAERRVVFYEIMDTAYDADQIHEVVWDVGHKPIIAIHSRRKKALPFDPATQERFKLRTVAERGNARLKDEFGWRHVRVRGAVKVFQHVMLGILALSADVLLKMAIPST